MALSSMIRKAYRSSVVSLTLRAIGSSATLNGSLDVQSHNLCSLTTAKDLVDKSLYKGLKNQIKYAKSNLKNQVIMPPESFPFKIEEEDIGCRRISLTRKFPDGEVIKVEVDTSALDSEEEIESDDYFSSSDDSSEDDNDISDDKKRDGSEKGSNENDSESKLETEGEGDSDDRAVPAIPMTVTIEKTGRGEKYLEFHITLSTKDIAINSLFISNKEEDAFEMLEGSKIKEMDFELQRCLYKYLEIRGIKVNMAMFLFKYIAQKKKKGRLLALKYLKKFIKH